MSYLSGSSASPARRLGVVKVVPRPCLHWLENPGGCLGPSGQREAGSSSPGDCGHIGACLGLEGQVTSPAHASIHSFSALNLIHKQPPPFPSPSHSVDVILPPPVSILRQASKEALTLLPKWCFLKNTITTLGAIFSHLPVFRM
uniref:Uncharacterized protein n=1 Tax=Pan troglodytes TaxID=9598 RepID=A0A2I3STW9_PANTR